MLQSSIYNKVQVIRFVVVIIIIVLALPGGG
jgi:hypothetical protein